MKRATPRVVPYSGSETSKYVVEGLRVAGKRVRRFFPTRRAGEAWLRLTLARVEKEGAQAAILMPETLRVEATAQAARLAPFGKTLTDAVSFYLEHLAAVARTCTVSALLKELLAAKVQDGASELYLKDLRNRLDRFAETFGERPAATIRAPEVDDWLRALELSPQSRNNYRTVLRTLFEFAVVRAYAVENPVEKTAKAKVLRPAPAIFTPTQFRTLLEKSPRDLVPWLAIGGFAGLRSAETERLDWSEVDLARRLIRIEAEKAKTAQRRLVHISDNLAAWLAPLAQKVGPVADRDRVRVARAQAVRAAKMTSWPTNALRHSFASYHLAHYKNAALTAAELGHTSPTMLYRHYREVVLPDDAAAWWQVTPAAEATAATG